MTRGSQASDINGRPAGPEDTVGASDILSAIRAGLETMSESQRRVGRLILDDPDWAVKANVEDIAARAGVRSP